MRENTMLSTEIARSMRTLQSPPDQIVDEYLHGLGTRADRPQRNANPRKKTSILIHRISRSF
jgi:hypothetical protein